MELQYLNAPQQQKCVQKPLKETDSYDSIEFYWLSYFFIEYQYFLYVAKSPDFKSLNFLFTNYKDIIISNEHLAKISPPFCLNSMPLRRSCCC